MIRNRARGMMLENDQIEGERTPEQSWGRRALQPLLWFMVLTVLVVSLLPGSALPSKTALLWDKAQHALAFAMLCGIGMKAYPACVRDVALSLLRLGGLIEFAQAATPWRHADIQDWFADAVGIAAVWLLYSIRRNLV